MKISEPPNTSEQLITELSQSFYSTGFVFHSPKVMDPTEVELGDVLIWVREWFVNIEVAWRNTVKGTSDKQLRKIVSTKRRKLESYFERYNRLKDSITVEDTYGKKISLEEYFEPKGYVGIVMIDTEEEVTNYHKGTVAKFQSSSFPIAVMTRQGFHEVISEVDTVFDLVLYIRDRFFFMKSLPIDKAKILLHLRHDIEPSLLAYYKLNDNSFDAGYFEDTAKSHITKYVYFKEKNAIIRDEENTHSAVIDQLIDIIRKEHSDNSQTLLHSWELAQLTRRERAQWAPRISDAFSRMNNMQTRRFFSDQSQSTGCWSLFIFSSQDDHESFAQYCNELARLKMIYEKHFKSFEYSVFIYAFRKSAMYTGNTFDGMRLDIIDAENITSYTEEEVNRAKQLFGHYSSKRIEEFPD